MSKKITNSVTWVGKVDWELKEFHGHEYSVRRGTSYNSYLVRDEKVALIDTVWAPFAKEFVRNLNNEIDIQKIDYVIAQHGEIDHSGALCELMRQIPDKPVYCTQNAIRSLKGQFHIDWNFVPVKTGDVLEIGAKKLIFVEAPMLHWPDSMFTYLTGENILFPNDAFGQHYATELLYNDLVDQCELFEEAIKYYANILTPFSPLVIKKISEVLGFNLPVDLICPSHGVIWRDDPTQIVKKYLEWADAYKENRILIVYDTMWNGTRLMAESIAKGITEQDKSVTVKLMNAAIEDKNDIITDIFRAKLVLIGSPTINNGYSHAIAGLLEMMKGLKFKEKRAAAFGSYGWSGEAVAQLTNALKGAGFDVISDGLRLMWMPDSEAIAKCVALGKTLAEETALDVENKKS